MNILLTFTGFHDPFSEGAVTGEREAGPVLTVCSERKFDRVYLFATPNTAEISIQTKDELLKRKTDRIVKGGRIVRQVALQ
jgi:hypothetical protein